MTRVFPWMQNLRKRWAGQLRRWGCSLQKGITYIHGDLIWNGKRTAQDFKETVGKGHTMSGQSLQSLGDVLSRSCDSDKKLFGV